MFRMRSAPFPKPQFLLIWELSAIWGKCNWKWALATKYSIKNTELFPWHTQWMKWYMDFSQCENQSNIKHTVSIRSWCTLNLWLGYKLSAYFQCHSAKTVPKFVFQWLKFWGFRLWLTTTRCTNMSHTYTIVSIGSISPTLWQTVRFYALLVCFFFLSPHSIVKQSELYGRELICTLW